MSAIWACTIKLTQNATIRAQHGYMQFNTVGDDDDFNAHKSTSLTRRGRYRTANRSQTEATVLT